jgi:glycine/D-amino acid oxidase-like deaminating enzyme
LVGQHRVHKNLYILNGLGSRGVLVAPTVAKNLIDFIEKGLALPKAIDLNRFTT